LVTAVVSDQCHYLPYVVQIQGASIPEVNGLYTCVQSTSCTSIDSEHIYTLALVHKVGMGGIVQRRWYVSDNRDSGRQVYGVVENTDTSTSTSDGASRDCKGAVQSSMKLPHWKLNVWKKITSIAGAKNEEEEDMTLSYFPIAIACTADGCPETSTAGIESMAQDALHLHLSAAIALQEATITYLSNGSGSGSRSRSRSRSGTNAELSRNEMREHVQQVTRKCVCVVLAHIMTQSDIESTSNSSNFGWGACSDGDYDGLDGGILLHMLEKAVTQQEHRQQQLVSPWLCYWATLEGAWDAVGKPCFQAVILPSSSSGTDHYTLDNSLNSHALRYAMLSLTVDMDPESVLRVHSHVHAHAHAHTSKDAVPHAACLWPTLRRIATTLAYAEMEVDIATISAESTASANSSKTCLVHVCATLQDMASLHEMPAIHDILTQICHYIPAVLQPKNAHIHQLLQNDVVDSPAAETTEPNMNMKTLSLSTDQSASLVVSLFGIGAIHTVGMHVCSAIVGQLFHTTIATNSVPNINMNDQQERNAFIKRNGIQTRDWCRGEVKMNGAYFDSGSGTDATRAQILLLRSFTHQHLQVVQASIHVREATRLHFLLTAMGTHAEERVLGAIFAPACVQRVAQKENILALLISAILQLTSPQVLATPTHMDQYTASESVLQEDDAKKGAGAGMEADLLRLLAVNSLDLLLDPICFADVSGSDISTRAGSDSKVCSIGDPISSVGVRGLFLLAYQKVGKFPHIEGDSSVPAQYRRLMQLTQTDWPWEYPCILTPAAPPSTATVSAKSRYVKLAFVSSFFHLHSVGRLLANVIRGLIQGQKQGHASTKKSIVFDIHVVDTSLRASELSMDALTIALKKEVISVYANNWHSQGSSHLNLTLSPSNPASIVKYLRALSCDIIIFGDNFMDSVTSHVLMMRSAPIQVLFWGHPYTTGYPTVDYFITGDTYEAEIVSKTRKDYTKIVHRFHSSQRDTDISVSLENATERSRARSQLGRNDDFSEQLVRFESLSFLMFSDISNSDAITSETSNVNANSPSNKMQEVHARDGNSLELHHLGLHGLHAVNLQGIPVDLELLNGNKPKTHMYSCLQSLMKMHPLFDNVLVGILLDDPQAVVLLLTSKKRQVLWHRMWSKRIKSLIFLTARNKIMAELNYSNRGGTDPVSDAEIDLDTQIQTIYEEISSRMIFFQQMPHARYQALLCDYSDIVLDPFPFGGGVTLVDALSCPRQSVYNSIGKDGVRSGSKFAPADTDTHDTMYSKNTAVVITSGALQTVHQLGSGISQRLGVLFNSSINGSSDMYHKKYTCCHTINGKLNKYSDCTTTNSTTSTESGTDTNAFSIANSNSTAVCQCTVDLEGNLLSVAITYANTVSFSDIKNMPGIDSGSIQNTDLETYLKIRDYVNIATCLTGHKSTAASASIGFDLSKNGVSVNAKLTKNAGTGTDRGNSDDSNSGSSSKLNDYLYGVPDSLHKHEAVQEWYHFLERVATPVDDA